ncbi:MAG: hypothetical protein Q9160_004195 [Pyrenula sp. 1 TL-2023]
MSVVLSGGVTGRPFGRINLGTLLGTPVSLGDGVPDATVGDEATTMLDGTDWLVAVSLPVGCIVCGMLLGLDMDTCVVSGVVGSETLPEDGMLTVGDVMGVDGTGSVPFAEVGTGMMVFPVDVFVVSVEGPVCVCVLVCDSEPDVLLPVPGRVGVVVGVVVGVSVGVSVPEPVPTVVLWLVPVSVPVVVGPVPVGGVVGVRVSVVLGDSVGDVVVPVPTPVPPDEESEMIVLPVGGMTVGVSEMGEPPEATEEMMEDKMDETSDVPGKVGVSEGGVGRMVMPVFPVPERIVDDPESLGPDGDVGLGVGGEPELLSVGKGMIVTPVPVPVPVSEVDPSV